MSASSSTSSLASDGSKNSRAKPDPQALGAQRKARDAEDVRLMKAFQKGDSRAFEQLLKRHKKPIYNFCLRMLGQQNLAEDAMQEVFLKVVRSAPRWQQNARFTTWLYAIARNHCIDTLRKESHRKTASLDEPLRKREDSSSTLGDRVQDQDAVTPDRGAESRRMRSTLVAAVASLSDEQREVFLMREHGGMPFKEIAQIVGVSENTAKSRMRYALENLRGFLAQKGIKPENT